MTQIDMAVQTGIDAVTQPEIEMNFFAFKHNGLLPMTVFENGAPLWFYVLFCAVAAIIAYFLGSMNFAVIISKYKFRDDIRKYGSGNAGMTNMLRTYGKGAAVFTLLGDVLKGVVSVFLGMALAGEAGAYIAGLACMLGHAFPCYYGFKGGKGVLVTAATLLCLEPVVFGIVFLVFVIIVAFTKFISLGSIIGSMLYPIFLNSLYPYLNYGLKEGAIPAIVSILNAGLVVWLHRENIKRLLAGKENKFSLKKKDKAPTANSEKSTEE